MAVTGARLQTQVKDGVSCKRCCTAFTFQLQAQPFMRVAALGECLHTTRGYMSLDRCPHISPEAKHPTICD